MSEFLCKLWRNPARTWSRMAGKLGGQRVTSRYTSCVAGRSVVRRLSRWDNAWIFYDNPAYQLKQADVSVSHGRWCHSCHSFNCFVITVILRLIVRYIERQASCYAHIQSVGLVKVENLDWILGNRACERSAEQEFTEREVEQGSSWIWPSWPSIL